MTPKEPEHVDEPSNLYSEKFEELSKGNMEQLRYQHALDKMENESANDMSPWDDIDQSLWNVKRILRHRSENGTTEIKVQLDESMNYKSSNIGVVEIKRR